ncbi:hypothetical protein [Methylomagnum sp.]
MSAQFSNQKAALTESVKAISTVRGELIKSPLLENETRRLVNIALANSVQEIDCVVMALEDVTGGIPE